MQFEVKTKKLNSNMKLQVKNIDPLTVGFQDDKGNFGRLVLEPTGVTWFKNNAHKHGKRLLWEDVFDQRGKRLITF